MPGLFSQLFRSEVAQPYALGPDLENRRTSMAEGLRPNQQKDLGSANCQRDVILLWLSSVDGQFLIFHVVAWIKHL